MSIKSLQNAKKTIDKFADSNYIIIKVCVMQTRKEEAKLLGISRVSYENKKKTGKFTTFEIKILCKTFNVKFDYLFEEVRG